MPGTKKSLGVLINPIAGLGGRVGLKGSDGADTVERALALGGKPESPQRAGRALEELGEIADQLDIYTYGGAMGEDTLRSLGFAAQVVGSPAGPHTTAQDSLLAAKLLKEAGVDLLLFAGGDGTARNICEAVGMEIPVIGIPAGVKIHSAVYAINPKNAGMAAKEYLEGKITNLKESEVMDIDEELFREGRVSARLYGYMNVPSAQSRIQHTKSGGASDEGDLQGMAATVAEEMEEGTLYIIGPGSTTRAVMQELGLPNTLLGVDVVQNRQLVAQDVTENQLWELIQNPALPVKIVVTVIGGQGSLFGRGNQQLSPRILRRVGKDNILVVATAAKLVALKHQPLLVDTGDPALDEELQGYVKVQIAFGQTMVYEVRS